MGSFNDYCKNKNMSFKLKFMILKSIKFSSYMAEQGNKDIVN
jgi:hypothetical protein